MVLIKLQVELEDGTVIEAKVEEKKKAEEKYQDSIAQGNTAYMAKKKGDNVITLSIGNLAPHATVSVLVSIAFPVLSESERWKFVLPGALTPFKDFGEKPTFRSAVPFSISYLIHLTSKQAISEVMCSTHAILVVNNSENDYTISLDPS